jgi:hypothetical protein
LPNNSAHFSLDTSDGTPQEHRSDRRAAFEHYYVIQLGFENLLPRRHRSSFAIPPQLDSFYSKLAADLKTDAFVARVLSDDSFKTVYFPKDTPDDQKTSLVRRVAGFLPSGSEVSIPYECKSIATLWTGTVTNSSKARVTTVQLYLSGAKFVLLKRDDNSTAPQSIENLVSIGDLRPGETVQLSIWSGSGFSYFSSGDIRLTHASGIGQVIVPRLVTGLPALIDKYDFIVYMLLFWIFAALVVPLSFERLSKWRATRRRI